MTVLIVAEAVVILLLGVLVVGLLRSHAEILRKLHELGAGDEDAPFRTADGVVAPRAAGHIGRDIAGSTPTGGAAAIRVGAGGQTTLLAFMSTTCTTCDEFWPRFVDEARLQSLGGIRLVIVTKGSQDEMPAEVARLAPQAIPVVMSNAAWEDYGVPGSPYFVMVDGGSGHITGEGSAGTWEKLLDLMGIADGDVAAGSGDRDRAARVDRELADAGILPGDPQLYGDSESGEDDR